jgi:hypothetical protein
MEKLSEAGGPGLLPLLHSQKAVTIEPRLLVLLQNPGGFESSHCRTPGQKRKERGGAGYSGNQVHLSKKDTNHARME